MKCEMVIPSFGCVSVDPVVLVKVTVSSVVLGIVDPTDVSSSSSDVLVELIGCVAGITAKR